MRYDTSPKESCGGKREGAREEETVRQLIPVIDEPRDHAPSAFFAA
jgi:hypothetical protein